MPPDGTMRLQGFEQGARLLSARAVNSLVGDPAGDSGLRLGKKWFGYYMLTDEGISLVMHIA